MIVCNLPKYYNRRMNIKQQAKQLKIKIPVIYLALKHKQTPIYAKALAIIIIIYALSPIDLIPDFIPILGLLDDIIILPALIRLCLHFIPQQIMDECTQTLKDTPTSLKKKWVFAIPFLLVWIIIGVMLLNLLR